MLANLKGRDDFQLKNNSFILLTTSKRQGTFFEHKLTTVLRNEMIYKIVLMHAVFKTEGNEINFFTAR